MKSGIYVITHVASGRKYVGSAVDIRSRWRVHKCELRKQKHHSPKLQNAWRRYGEDAFSFEVVELISDLHGLIPAEQKWMDSLKPFYNCRPRAGSQLGLKLSPETRERISRVQRGRKASAETRARMSKAQTGRRHTEETKRKLSKMKKGKPGIPLSDQAKAKLSAAFKGRVMTEEHKRKISEAQKGRPLKPEHLANIRASQARRKAERAAERARQAA